MRQFRGLAWATIVAVSGAQALNSEDRSTLESHLLPLIDEGLYTATEMNGILTRIVIDNSVIDAITRPAEKSTWGKYRDLFITDSMISMGQSFKKQHWSSIESIGQQYGVNPSIMLAITGIETRFGSYMGRNDVVDSLATLALRYEKRSDFFTSEFVNLMYLAREEQLDIFSLVGSYAGAMGIPQFMPSSYRNFAVDQNSDGKRDLFTDIADIYGSVANYLADHGWREGEIVKQRVTLTTDAQKALVNNERNSHRPTSEYVDAAIIDDASNLPAKARLIEFDGKNGTEYYLAFTNFDVIMTYNRSPLYAMAVSDLADALRD